MNCILYDPSQAREQLLPLTFTRPVALLRHGIMTVAEKWALAMPGAYSFLTQDYLSAKWPAAIGHDNLFIAGNTEPTPALVRALAALSPGCSLTWQGREVARRAASLDTPVTASELDEAPPTLDHVWELFTTNGDALERDFDVLTAGRSSQPLDPTNTLVGPPEKLFIEEGATVLCSNINTLHGPVYVGRGAEIMEGASVRGPLALCQGAALNMGAKVYGPTTLGPHCKAGGELNNVVMTGYSNKSHDGFLGNAVVGEWCNLGAGCVASNLKNTYGKIRLWSYPARGFQHTDLQFCGLIMGDHSKAGINTMFNTATVVGVGVNFYGAGFPRTYLPSFTQGSPAGMKPVRLEQFFETAEIVMARRGMAMTEQDRDIFRHLAEATR